MLGNDEFHQDEFATAPSPLSTNISGNGGEILTDKPSLTPLPSYDGTFVGQPIVSTHDDPGSDKLKTIVEHLNIGNISGNGGDFMKDPRSDDVQLMMEAHPHYTPCDPNYYNYNSYDPPFEDNHSWYVKVQMSGKSRGQRPESARIIIFCSLAIVLWSIP